MQLSNRDRAKLLLPLTVNTRCQIGYRSNGSFWQETVIGAQDADDVSLPSSTLVSGTNSDQQLGYEDFIIIYGYSLKWLCEMVMLFD